MENSVKVLIVDDEKPLAHALSIYLTKAGYVTEEAYDGQEALDKIAASPPQIILLDILMPKLGGIETLQILKKQPATSHIPVIMLTNIDDPEQIDKVAQLGSLLYFIKGSSPLSMITNYIHEVLGK